MASDTTELVRLRHRAQIAKLSPTERLRRTFMLSAFVREVAWAGAQRTVGALGPAAVRERFLMQLYGHDMSDALRVLIARAARL